RRRRRSAAGSRFRTARPRPPFSRSARGIPRIRRTGARPAGSPSRRSCEPSRGSLFARRSARTKSCLCFALLIYNALVLVRTVFIADGTPRPVMVSLRLSGFRRRLEGPEPQPVGAEDQECPPEPGQDRARDLDRDQGPDHSADHPPTSHPERGPEQEVALSKVSDPADDRGRDDGDERGALGDRLRESEADRHRRYEKQAAADPDRAAEEAGAEAPQDQEHIRPAHGSSSSLIPTTPRTRATAILSSRSGIRRSRRAPA